MMYRTDRLCVRRLTENDAAAMALVYGDQQAMKWVDDGSTMNEDECLAWIYMTLRNYERRGYGMSAIELHPGEVVGFIGIVHPNDQPEAEVKYALRREYWGQGIASEAVAGMLTYMNDTFGTRVIIATIDPENAASRRVLEKSGLRFDRLERQADGSEVEYLSWSG